MKKHAFVIISLFTITGIVLTMLLSRHEEDPRQGLPWDVKVFADGSSQVFGIHLGNSTIAQAEQYLREPAIITLFYQEGEVPVVEAYFEKLTLKGIHAKLVVAVQVSDEEAQGFFERGIRISKLGSGKRKVELGDADMARVKGLPIQSVTYIPSINLDEQQITAKFGAPKQSIQENKPAVTHMLYPDRGLDVVFSEDSKELFQYVKPAAFATLAEPLLVLTSAPEEAVSAQ